MTEKLYWKTPYKTNFKAEVIKVAGNKIVLDKTLFYPSSGGQESDHGNLKFQEFSFNVVDCIKENGDIIHILRTSPDIFKLSVGVQISGTIEWNNRYLTMKSHSSQHIISAYADKVLNAKTVRAVILPGEVTIQFNRQLSLDDVKNLLEAVTILFCVKKARIKTYVLPREKAIEKYSKIIRGKLVQDNPMRIVEIIEEDGNIWDVMCCGGTHVKNSIEIGPMFLQKFNKGNEIKYVIGNKAIELISSANVSLIDISGELNQPYDKIPDTVRKNIDEIRNISQLNKDLSFKLLNLLSSHPSFHVNNLNIILTTLPLERRFITSAFKNFPDETLLIVNLSELAILILSSSDIVNASDLMKLLTSEYGGKGGGGPKVAQGTLNKMPTNLELIIRDFITK